MTSNSDQPDNATLLFNNRTNEDQSEKTNSNFTNKRLICIIILVVAAVILVVAAVILVLAAPGTMLLQTKIQNTTNTSESLPAHDNSTDPPQSTLPYNNSVDSETTLSTTEFTIDHGYESNSPNKKNCPKQKIFPEWCTQSSLMSKIVGGELTDLNEYSSLSLLVYKKLSN